MTEYDDGRYLDLCEALRDIIDELMDMDGNTQDTIRDEVDFILENYV